jgi:transcription elongation factor
MTSNQTVLDREMFVQALRYMDEQDLRFLNRMVVERLNLLAQARSTVQLAQFSEGDRVEFTDNEGATRQATVLRLNKKTATLLTDDAHHWKVPAGLLRKLSPPA